MNQFLTFVEQHSLDDYKVKKSKKKKLFKMRKIQNREKGQH